MKGVFPLFSAVVLQKLLLGGADVIDNRRSEGGEDIGGEKTKNSSHILSFKLIVQIHIYQSVIYTIKTLHILKLTFYMVSELTRVSS